MQDDALAERVDVVRRFSRFYTRRIGLLHERLLGGTLSLAEGRIVYELARIERDPSAPATAATLAAELGLDAGYLSRILRSLQDRGLIGRQQSETDGRQSMLSLTSAGRDAFAVLDARSRAEIELLLDTLTPAEQQRLATSLRTVEALLGGGERRAPYVLRGRRPGDMGWVVHRHGALYSEEYGFDERFEDLVAGIVTRFIETFDPRRERCWIAEREGDIVGSVFLMRQSDELAQLRLLYVEPAARGLGIGRHLVEECIRFADQAGYRRLTLWTNDILTAARAIYQRAGFTLVEEERHHSFGQDLVGQNWQLELRLKT